MLADLVTWWPQHALELFSRARRFQMDRVGEATGVDPRHGGELVVWPWPQWPSGEPDLVLEYRRDNGFRSLLIVEAKLGAPKSSTDIGGALGGSTRDQLGKYYWDAVTGRDQPGARLPERVDVIYLTHHSGPPIADLRESWKAITPSGSGPALGALYWLSWFDVEEALRNLAGTVGSRERAFASAAAVLRQGGYERFSGTWHPDPPVPVRGRMSWLVTRSWGNERPLVMLADDPVYWRGR